MEIVIALLMFLNSNGTPVLKEHLLMPSMSECLKRKRIAIRSSNNAVYQCMRVNAVVKDGKIISISKSD
jgi:hypothetical protein